MVIKNKLNKIKSRLKSAWNRNSGAKFQLHSYKNADGTFDYDLYRKIQTEGNKRKIDSV